MKSRIMGYKNIDELRSGYREMAEEVSLNCQVLMDGSINAEIAVIGEGPGQQEVNLEQPFVGESGRKLWDHLRRNNVLRTNVYATNVSKRQISLHKNSRYPISAEEWMKWQMMLEWELAQLPNLKYILCMGNAGIQALFGWTGVSNYRGSVYEWKGKTVLVCFNPAAVLRNPKDEIVFAMDMGRFNKVISGEHKVPVINHIINPSFKDAMEYSDMLIHSDNPYVSFDIETISGETACFGIGNSPTEAMCINMRQRYRNTFAVDEEIKLLFKLQELFDKKKIIAQNGNFDAHWVGYKDLIHCEIALDTLLMHHTLYPTLPHSLAFLTSQYTNHPFYKDELEQFKEGGDIDLFWRYNCKDVAITYDIAMKILEELKAQNLDDFYFNHVQRLDKYLVRTTCDGVRVDNTIKESIAGGLTEELETLTEDFHELAQKTTSAGKFYRPNLGSPKQVQDLFLNRLGLRSPQGNFDKPVRDKLLMDTRTPMEAQQLIIKYNEITKKKKFSSTYANSRIDNDARIRYQYKQTGVVAAPGRLSSSKTLWGTGMNMQNQPKAAYKFYLSDPGTVMFYFDLAQAEARIVAWLADIDKWKHDFEQARLGADIDVHRSLASEMYKVPYDKVPKEDFDSENNMTIRYKGKRSRHGLNYTMNWPTLAETTGMIPYEAKKSYILYHQVNPEIKLWWDVVFSNAKKNKELWNCLGRRLKIFGRIDKDDLGNLVAFKPQSTIGDKVKKVWYQCEEDDEWDNNKMRIKLNIHDALIGFATEYVVDKALMIAKKYAEEPILVQNERGTSTDQVIIPADLKKSVPDEKGFHRWSTLKDFQLN